MARIALVTGAAGNMGFAVVNKFTNAGYQVIGTTAPNETIRVQFPKQNFEAIEVDLAQEEVAGKFVESVIAQHSSIDVAVLTVGGFALGKIADTSTADINKQLKLNFETAYNVARPVFNKMMEQGSGRIFIIGSRPGLDARYGKGMVAYGLAKSLLFRLAQLMNEEAKGKEVVTSVVVPSTIDTPQNRKSMPDADFDAWVSPGAIADVIYFYCTPEAAVLREPVIKIYNKA
jgi:NAD(P)-dependent dehydrogenase (short-subunit alcohol dehydrogenase family)